MAPRRRSRCLTVSCLIYLFTPGSREHSSHRLSARQAAAALHPADPSLSLSLCCGSPRLSNCVSLSLSLSGIGVDVPSCESVSAWVRRSQRAADGVVTPPTAFRPRDPPQHSTTACESIDSRPPVVPPALHPPPQTSYLAPRGAASRAGLSSSALLSVLCLCSSYSDSWLPSSPLHYYKFYEPLSLFLGLLSPRSDALIRQQ